MIKYIPLFELPVLIIMVLIRSVMLRRHGIKAIVFGVSDKTDFFIIPIILFFFYGLFASFLNLPFPIILIKSFWNIFLLNIFAIIICTVSLIWFCITLIVFGKSFRVGIDENTKGTLITKGTFAKSRNPIYLGFIAFFMGIFIAYSNILLLLLLLFLIIMIHRQILREEKFLKDHYGNEYREYCKKVRRYI
jgi:protein-S-isoprenylcysteine O-methyltransferase Ste14